MMNSSRAVLKSLSRALFLTLDRFGFHLLPKHFYTPVPDIAWLRRNRSAWQEPARLVGIEWDLDAQLHWLDEICAPHYASVRDQRLVQRAAAGEFGPGYGFIEGQVLYCFMRSKRPARVLEVGAGMSTAVMLTAAEANRADGYGMSALTCVEPYPKPHFSSITGITHIKEECQTVSSRVFEQLEAGDLLFIDSSHSVKIGSEVSRIYLDIIPRLRPGVFVHIHDIYLPYLYPRDALTSYMGWQETVLVLALLVNNPNLRVVCCQAALHYDRPSELAQILSEYQPRANDHGLDVDGRGGHFPSSLWLETA
jgi:predicted O-methyltransferase YrrM